MLVHLQPGELCAFSRCVPFAFMGLWQLLYSQHCRPSPSLHPQPHTGAKKPPPKEPDIKLLAALRVRFCGL